MAYFSSTTICYTSSDFGAPRPDFVSANTQYAGNSYGPPVFSNKSIKLHLNSFLHGTVRFKITFTGPLKYLISTYLHPNGQPVSISIDNTIYQVSSPTTGIIGTTIYENGVQYSNEFYVVVNGYPNMAPDNILDIRLAAGVFQDQLSSLGDICVRIDYDCTTPIYSAETGLHVWSEYDAQYSRSDLKTILYSLTPVSQWTTSGIGTKVYSNPLLQNPALPYYYGVGGLIYKVGDDWFREYGTKIHYHIHKKRFQRKKKTKITKIVDGPQFWGPYDSTTNPYSPACIVPKMSGVGLIKRIIKADSTIKPKQYRYYMGYSTDGNPETSVTSVFRIWDWNNQTSYPVTGSVHALSKLGEGFLAGMDTMLGNLTGIGLTSLNQFSLLGAAAGLSVVGVNALLAGGTGAGCASTIGLVGYGGVAASAAFPPLLIILLIVSIIVIIFTLFRPVNKDYYEDCTNFLHHFTDTPYISANTKTQLFRDINNRVVNSGWHSDGIYYYNQTSGYITEKRPVCLNNSCLRIDPLSFGYDCSLLPDNPKLVTDWTKLIVLPYVSGKPVPYCTGQIYYNKELNYVSELKGCCTYELCTPIKLTIPAGYFYSCYSQSEADSYANTALQSAINYAIQNYQPLPSLNVNTQLGFLNSYFTHELKVENNPTEVTVEFDGSLNPNATIGTRLYYDECGCTPVLDGFYAITGDTIFRTFYHTTNGRIDRILYMLTSNSFSTTTGELIVKTNLDYTSNWFLTDSSESILNYFVNLLTVNTNRNFDPTVLYNNYRVTSPFSYTYKLKKGFVKYVNNISTDFKVYNNFTTPSYSDALSGWYTPLVDWVENTFWYQQTTVVSINFVEDCTYLNGNTTTRGFYIVGRDSNGNEIPIQDQVNVNISLLSGSTVISTYNITTNSTSNPFIPYGNLVPFNAQFTTVGISINPPTSNITYVVGTYQFCTTNISNQIWRTNNLSVTKYNNGDNIPFVNDPIQWSSLTTGAYCCPNNDCSPSNIKRYGYLYNWFAINDPRGVLPSGWHIPTTIDWSTLSSNLGGDSVSGGKLKEIGTWPTYSWLSPNPSTNDYGFTALGAGYRDQVGTTGQFHINSGFWASNDSGGLGQYRFVSYDNTNLGLTSVNKRTGLSVRSIKN